MMHHEVANLLPMGMGIDQHAILYRAEDRIVRAIKPRATEFYREVLRHPTVVGLMKDGILIETRESDIKIKGHDLVLEHPLLPVVSYPFEWTPNMYRDAAMTVLRLNAELLNAGLCTHDAHLWNVLFDGITPRFIDFTSIIKALPGNKWRAKAQFTNYCLNPLLVMDAGFPTTARSLLREILSYPDPVMVRTLLHGPVRTAQISDQVQTVTHRLVRFLASRLAPDAKQVLKKVWGVTQRVSSILKNEDEIADVRALLHDIELLKLSPPIAQWSEYYAGNNELPIYDGSQAVLDRIRDSTPKHGLVSDILRKLNPKSVLDLGCNRGLYSQIAALQGSRVVGVDLDERALDDMYLDSKRMKTDALPLYINAVAPVEATGFQEIPFPTVAKRLRAELVMGLALVHHLVFKTTRMSFAHIAKLFDSYAEKCILVEFVPKEDVHIRSWYTDEFDWYTLDNFKLALSEYFPALEVFESFPSPRVILYGVKK